jgi:hypothetical protein
MANIFTIMTIVRTVKIVARLVIQVVIVVHAKLDINFKTEDLNSYVYLIASNNRFAMVKIKIQQIAKIKFSNKTTQLQILTFLKLFNQIRL